jgi:hypothetical protein
MAKKLIPIEPEEFDRQRLEKDIADVFRILRPYLSIGPTRKADYLRIRRQEPIFDKQGN